MIEIKNHIISEEVVRARVPGPIKDLIRQEVKKRGTGTTESDLLREILCDHFGVAIPVHPWKKD